MLKPNFYRLFIEILLKCWDLDCPEMENTCGQRRIGLSNFKDLKKIFEPSRSAGSNYRHGDRGRNSTRQFNIKTVLCPIGIHRGQQDLARSKVNTLFGPSDSVTLGRQTTAIQIREPHFIVT